MEFLDLGRCHRREGALRAADDMDVIHAGLGALDRLTVVRPGRLIEGHVHMPRAKDGDPTYDRSRCRCRSAWVEAAFRQRNAQRRQEFWRNIDPATGLTDPSLPRAATPESSSTSCRSCSNSSSTAATPPSSAQIAFIVSANGPDAGG